jgi:transposase
MTTQGKALTPAERETIVALKKYFDRTKEDIQEQASPSILRVVNALGVGIATVKRVMADYNRGVTFTEQEKIHKGRPPRVLSDSMQTITREYVRNANMEGAHITLETLCKHLKDIKPEQEFSLRTLVRQAKLGASCRVKDPVGQGLANHPY